jgi:hypothetical protein
MIVGVVEARQEWIAPRWCVKARDGGTVRSAAPRPVGESVSSSNERTHIILQQIVELHYVRWLPIVRADRARQRVGEFVQRYRSTDKPAHRCRWSRYLGADEELGKIALIVFQENRPVLQKRVPIPDLCTADKLPSTRYQLARHG